MLPNSAIIIATNAIYNKIAFYLSSYIYNNFFYGNEHDFFKVKPYMNHVVPFYEKWGLHIYFFYLNFADKLKRRCLCHKTIRRH